MDSIEKIEGYRLATSMTLRDWFAGQALAGFTTLSDNEGEAMGAADCAKAAYNYADAMMEARKA